jgi:hypothetical protein
MTDITNPNLPNANEVEVNEEYKDVKSVIFFILQGRDAWELVQAAQRIGLTPTDYCKREVYKSLGMLRYALDGRDSNGNLLIEDEQTKLDRLTAEARRANIGVEKPVKVRKVTW